MKAVAIKILNQKKSQTAQKNFALPVLIFTINNGAAHTRAAEAIADVWRENNPQIPVRVVEVSDFMSRKAKFTHVSLYLWLVKNAPQIWGKIDEYQKRQTSTSPEWFYRRECRALFDFVEKTKPSALIATEVGCCEIAALIKRDLNLTIPLVAVNLDYEADRAWIQKEVDLYCLATDWIESDFVKQGANCQKIKIWGVPLSKEFKNFTNAERRKTREKVCVFLKFDAENPLIIISGGGEGLGEIEEIVKIISHLPAQIAVLTGRNEKLKTRLEKIANSPKIKILGWTENVAELMQSADILISKLGLTFYEAMACNLPIIALEPPPGAERIQYNLLEKFGVGRAVKTVSDVSNVVAELLANETLLMEMRRKTEIFGHSQAAENIAFWLEEKIEVFL